MDDPEAPGMKRSASAVKFAEPQPGTEQNSTSTAPKSKGMKYGRILHNLTGSSKEAVPEGPKKSFNPSAAPAKPAMKTSRSGTDLASGRLYPSVDEDGNPITYTPAVTAPNPATGLVGYQTRGGAALASALGVPDGLAIPPTCPPALPTVVRPDGGQGSSADILPRVTGSVSNPLAVPDMPLMAPLAPTAKPAAAVAPAAAAAADLHTAMPATAVADGVVQLTTGSYDGTAKLATPDVGSAAGAVQRDQQRKSGEWHKPAAAAGGWQAVPGSGGAAHSKDIETAAVDQIESPTAGAGKGLDYDDDASR